MTIVSKVSLAVSLIIEIALPDFSLFLDLQRYDFYRTCTNFSSLVFICKSTTIARNLFAFGLFSVGDYCGRDNPENTSITRFRLQNYNCHAHSINHTVG